MSCINFKMHIYDTHTNYTYTHTCIILHIQIHIPKNTYMKSAYTYSAYGEGGRLTKFLIVSAWGTETYSYVGKRREIHKMYDIQRGWVIKHFCTCNIWIGQNNISECSSQ